MDDNHHPVPITKNNLGSLTDQMMFGLRLRDDFQLARLMWLSLSPHSLTVSANLLVLFTAFVLRIMPQFNLTVNAQL